ncbi:hypothetical protein [Cellulomonas sp. Leaf334]|uniref:hypothetical protein n=1 Tax=Cellulomonas sp. Leaf334 TaxID=1736339 RepID=UPI000701381A|nr:hypothetical protein [Cellulomonas sp. Leaf334]KQR11711.1 hypothetical protein ASF78_10755 [Cellulomonas sp. Leaf334]
MTGIAEERDRILALLRLTDDPAVRETDPVPSAEDVGAADALGLDWPDEQAHVSVYLFADYDDAVAAQERLRGYGAQTDLTTETAVNGDLLLWAVAPGDDDDALARIDGLAGSFSGRE